MIFEMSGPSFVCLRCGKCCTDLLAEDKGVLRGLTLLPGERHLFPETLVKPAVGLGRRPHEQSFRIIAHQLTENTCPHLEGGLCGIYAERPVSCRQFPFSLGRGLDGSLLVGYDYSCPALFTSYGKPTGDLGPDIRPHAEKLLGLETEALKNPRRAWYYDLATGKWVRYSELLKG